MPRSKNSTTPTRSETSESPQSKASRVASSIGVARYNELATLFRRYISLGRWKVGEQIPTIGELATEHWAAKETVRRALDILANERLIERFRAKGTFVTHHPEEKMWCEIETDWAGLLRARRDAIIETLEEKANQPPPVVPDFSGKMAKKYRYFRRRHWRNNEPFLCSEMYFDESIFKGVPHDALANKAGLQFLAETRGLELADFRQTLTIGSADLELAETLKLHLNAPVAFMRRQAVDKTNKLVFAGETVYRGDVFWLSMKLKPE